MLINVLSIGIHHRKEKKRGWMSSLHVLSVLFIVFVQSCENRIVLWKPGSRTSELQSLGSKTSSAEATTVSQLHQFDFASCTIWFMRFAMDHRQRVCIQYNLLATPIRHVLMERHVLKDFLNNIIPLRTRAIPSTLELCSLQGAIQIHVYLTLSRLHVRVGKA